MLKIAGIEALIFIIVNEHQVDGVYEISWNSENYSSGIFLSAEN